MTESGLSMVHWKLLGESRPKTEQEWIAEFEHYKQFPEFKMYVNDLSLLYNIAYCPKFNKNYSSFMKRGLSLILYQTTFATNLRSTTLAVKKEILIDMLSEVLSC